jgi:hypothetical protein
VERLVQVAHDLHVGVSLDRAQELYLSALPEGLSVTMMPDPQEGELAGQPSVAVATQLSEAALRQLLKLRETLRVAMPT